METTVPIFGTPEAAAKFWLLIFGLWAVCAVVNVALADLKGRSYWVWGLLGLCFGPLGVMLMLFLHFRKKKLLGENKPTAEKKQN